MPIAIDLIGIEVVPAHAERLGYSSLTAINAAGTTTDTATVINSFVTQIEVTASTGHTGLRLPDEAAFQQGYFVLNSSSTNASIYPPIGSSIDGGLSNAATNLDTNVSRIFVRIDRSRWVTIGASANAPITSNILIVTSGTVITVPNSVQTLILNKIIAGATSVQLGSVLARTSSLQIVDFAGNAGDITILPFGSETIMGLSSATLLSYSAGLGASANVTLWPNAAVNGWYNAT